MEACIQFHEECRFRKLTCVCDWETLKKRCLSVTELPVLHEEPSEAVGKLPTIAEDPRYHSSHTLTNNDTRIREVSWFLD